jgi:hypothetical protein
MKAERVFTLIGKKLEKGYKKLGLKYSRKYMFLKTTTKKYDYYIFFSPFFEHIPDTYIELRVALIINDRILLKTNIYANSELFHMDLWETGNHYNIANEALLNNVFIDLKSKIEKYFIPQIKKLEGESR